jgi:hypothetical protein
VHGRLLRALRRYVHASEDLHRIDSIGGFWYARRGIDAALHLPAAPLDLLRGAVSPTQLNGNPVRTVLHGCLDLLSGQGEYRRAVLEHDVLDMTMSFLQLHHASETEPETQSPDAGDAETASAALLASLEDARGWVQERYVSRGKLGEREAEAMLEAIHRYIEDLQQRDVLGHFSYLRRSMPGLTQQRYRKSYRNLYEYILRTIFTNARQRLQ